LHVGKTRCFPKVGWTKDGVEKPSEPARHGKSPPVGSGRRKSEAPGGDMAQCGQFRGRRGWREFLKVDYYSPAL